MKEAKLFSNPITPPSQPPAGAASSADKRLEQAFLEEMLKYAGPKPQNSAFGGGIGEEQFTTFLTREYAAILSGALDLGLQVERKEIP